MYFLLVLPTCTSYFLLALHPLAPCTPPQPPVTCESSDVRHVRREAIETLKTEQKAGDITEDDLSHGEKEVQKLTDAYVKKVDEHLTAKEEDILTV